MCGIFGCLTSEPIPSSCPEALARIHHRGPDEGGWCHDGPVLLGIRRLSIIDLAGGQQPMWNKERTHCIVYNGELYNFLDLREELASLGHVFRTRSDTEVILHAFEQWGADCLRYFNGMFAFAIWDRQRRVLFLARDRLGEKPLYYYCDSHRLVFASEIKAILTYPGVPRTLNLRGLVNFLTFGHAVAPESMYQNIYKLLPGHFLITEPDSIGFRMVEYWDVGGAPPLPAGAALAEDDYAERVSCLLADSVRRRLIADVPLGAFLSGGIDSSAVVALMRQFTTGKVKTFSLGFSIGGKYNELPDARRVAEHLDTEHHELCLDHDDLVQTLRTLVYHYDEPFGDPAGFPVYRLSRFAREHVTVVLTGDGGDELFGGYPRYVLDQLMSGYGRLPHALSRTLIPAMLRHVSKLRDFTGFVRTLAISDPAIRYAAWLTHATPELLGELLLPDTLAAIDGHDPTWPFPRYYWKLNGTAAADHLNRLMYIDLKTLLADGYLEKTDKATMACSLEARVPFLDHRLVELAFQIPGRIKIRRRTTKRILKRALRHLLPAEILDKPKQGFSVPINQWFRGTLKDFTFEVLLDSRTRSRGYFNPDTVERMWREHADGRRWHDQLWLLLNFELWHRLYLDREAI